VWNDLFDLRPTNKEVAFGILIVFVLLLGAGFAGYLLGWERCEDVYCNGAGTESVGNKLDEAGTAISNAGAGISEAQGHADQIASGIKSAKESVDYISGTAKDSTELIRQSQSIIEAIRNRGQANPPAN